MGRRSYQRYSVLPTSEGVLRVLRDVVVQSATDRELVVFSSEPGVLQTTMALELRESLAAPRPLSVRVVESQPVVTNGTVRHRLTLSVVDSSALASVSEEAAVMAPARQ